MVRKLDWDIRHGVYIKGSNILWKIIGIGVVTFLSLSSAFIRGEFLERYHNIVMLWAFIVVVLLCGLLINNFLQIVRLQQEQIEGLRGIELSLTSLIDLKDHYTEGHSMSVRDLARRFAEFLKLSPEEVDEITVAAELHDIGKIGIPDIILKKTGTLNEEEFAVIKNHPVLGAESIQSLKGFENISIIIMHHHERYDGTGYPDGLSLKQIPMGSRIIHMIARIEIA